MKSKIDCRLPQSRGMTEPHGIGSFVSPESVDSVDGGSFPKNPGRNGGLSEQNAPPPRLMFSLN